MPPLAIGKVIPYKHCICIPIPGVTQSPLALITPNKVGVLLFISKTDRIGLNSHFPCSRILLYRCCYAKRTSLYSHFSSMLPLILLITSVARPEQLTNLGNLGLLIQFYE